VHGNDVLDQEFFGAFRVMGMVVHQVFDEVAVFDMDYFVVVKRNLKAAMLEDVAFRLEFVASNVALVQEGMIDDAFAEKIAPGNARVLEMEMERVMKGQSIEGIEPGNL